MKKRIITLLAVLALLVTCAVFAVQADETTTETETVAFMDQLCPCGSGKTLREETWKQWGQNNNYKWSESDHYIVGSYNSLGSAQSLTGVDGKLVILARKGLTDADNGAVTLGIKSATTSAKFANNITNDVTIIGENVTIQSNLHNANNGGLFRVNSGGSLTIKGNVTLQPRSGYTSVPTSGGLIAVMPGGSCTLEGVTLKAVKCTQGGAVFVNSGTLNMTDCTIQGVGTPSSGGAIAVDIYGADTIVNVTNTTITDCSASVNGGAIYVTGNTVSGKNKYVTLDGCTISGCTAAGSGGVAYLSVGNLNVKDCSITANAESTGGERGIMLATASSKCNLYGTTEIISANVNNGDGVYVYKGTLTLSDSATVKNSATGAGTYEKNICRAADEGGIVQVSSGWTGTASIAVPGFSLQDAGSATGTAHGQAFAASVFDFGSFDNDFAFTAGTSKTAQRINLFLEYPSHENPQMAGYEGLLVTMRAQLYENGVATWYVQLADAIYAYIDSKASSKYIKTWTGANTTRFNTTLYVDFNGYDSTNYTLGSSGKVYAFDSTAKPGEAGASIGIAAQPITKAGGVTYVCTDGVIYPVSVEVTNVSLRPGTAEASMYYTAKVTAHADAGIDAWGVAVTLDENETTLANHLYTRETDASKMGAFNGVLVKGIAKNGAEDNAARAAQPIYAKAYIEVDGQVAMSAAVNKTLKQVVDAVVAMDQTGLTQVQVAAIEAMQATAWFASINA